MDHLTLRKWWSHIALAEAWHRLACEDEARKRLADAERREVKGQRDRTCDRKRDRFTVEFEGAAAELAFSILSKGRLLWDQVRGPADILLRDTRGVDVKTTAYHGGRLVAHGNELERRVDLFVLMVGRFPFFEFRGWALNHELLDVKNRWNPGQGECFALIQTKLHDRLDCSDSPGDRHDATGNHSRESSLSDM